VVKAVILRAWGAAVLRSYMVVIVMFLMRLQKADSSRSAMAQSTSLRSE
jgi:hypothetical protein